MGKDPRRLGMSTAKLFNTRIALTKEIDPVGGNSAV